MGAHRSATRPTAISIAASGDNTLAAAPASGPINVYGIFFTVSGATNVTFKDGTTALSGAIILTGNGSSITLPLQEEPWFQVQPGNAFILNSSNNVNIGGVVYYTTG